MTTQYAAPIGQIDHTVGTAPYTDVPAMTTNPTQVNTAPTDPIANHSAPSYDQVKQLPNAHDNGSGAAQVQSGAIVQNTGTEQIFHPTTDNTNEKAAAMNGQTQYQQSQGQEFGGTGQSGAGGLRPFKHGLFDCFDDVELCLCSTFLPCVVYGKIAHRLRDPTLTDYSEVNTDCLIWYGLTYACGIQWLVQMMQRTMLRKKHSIEGDDAQDCLISWCCACCSLAQSEKELREPLMGGSAPIGMQNQPQGYAGDQTRAEGMQYGQTNTASAQPAVTNAAPTQNIEMGQPKV